MILQIVEKQMKIKEKITFDNKNKQIYDFGVQQRAQHTVVEFF